MESLELLEFILSPFTTTWNHFISNSLSIGPLNPVNFILKVFLIEVIFSRKILSSVDPSGPYSASGK